MMGSSLTFASILSLLMLGGNIQLPQDAAPKVNQAASYHLPSFFGLWQLQLEDQSDPSCQEQIYFAQNNQFTVQSGAEFGYGEYRVVHHNQSYPSLALKIIYENNQVDCSGQQIDQSGEMNLAYVKQDGNKMQWCTDRQGQDCPMTFYRVLP